MRLAAVFAMFAVVACSRTRVPPAPAALSAPGVVAIESNNLGTVVGIVEDSTGTPLDQALLVLDNRRGMQTDSTGRFRFDAVPPGAHNLRARHFGFFPATQAFTLGEGSAPSFVFRLSADTRPLVDVCTTEARTSVVVRVPKVAGAIVTVAHADSVKRFTLDAVNEKPDKDGMLSVGAFSEVAGHFDVTVTAPGHRTWRADVSVPNEGMCQHVITQVVTARMVPES